MAKRAKKDPVRIGMEVKLLVDSGGYLRGQCGGITDIKKQDDGQTAYKFSAKGAYEWFLRHEFTTDVKTPLGPRPAAAHL